MQKLDTSDLEDNNLHFSQA